MIFHRACNNCYYIEKQDKTQDIIMAMGRHEIENQTDLQHELRLFFFDRTKFPDYFLIYARSSWKYSKIADMVDIKIETWWILIPTFELPEEHKKFMKNE